MTTATFGERAAGFLRENWREKLLSFGCALLLYSLVHGGQDARRSIVVDLEASLPPEHANKILVGNIPKSIRVTVRGTNQAMDELRASTVAMQVDLTSGRESHLIFEPKMVQGPQGVKFEVEQFDPPSMDLQWEERIVRDVPVQVSVVGTPAHGFVVKGVPIADPPRVRVTGPMSDVAVLQHVRADGFDVTGLSEGSYPRQLAFERLSPRLGLEPTRIIVTAEIMREIAERPFAKLPVVVVGTPKAKTLPAEVDVRLVCPPDLLRGLRAEQVVPRVVLHAPVAKEGSESRPVEVRIDRCEAHVTPRDVVVRW